jgi:hypothetical protein
MINNTRTLVLIVLKVLLLVVRGLDGDGRANRSCQSQDECIFQNKVIDTPVYLTCSPEFGSCVCKTRVSIAIGGGDGNIADWGLEPTAEGDCLISQSGPCGQDQDQGLELKCQAGLQCLEGRCRDPLTGIRRIPRGQLCHENIECQEGLICKVLKVFSFYTESYCVESNGQI